jgi:ABC-type multidrug transport system fused ATPase/permease subunit
MSFLDQLIKDPASIDETRASYYTIFGFDTTSKIAAKFIDIVYWFIIFVAYCFAFHALNNILITWHWLLVGLACFAVVGLPYCVKIILFGRKEFPIKAALLCAFLSLLPTIFDFTGLYAETGVQDSLKTSKIQIAESLSYFEAESKKSAQTQEQEILERWFYCFHQQ